MRLVVVTGALEGGIREALETEVPVRRDGVPARTTVLRFVDLLQTEADVVLVGGVDRRELVVPGPATGLVSRQGNRDETRRARRRKLARIGNLGPRTILATVWP